MPTTQDNQGHHKHKLHGSHGLVHKKKGQHDADADEGAAQDEIKRPQTPTLATGGLALPVVPDEVEFKLGSFVNAQGLKLATYAWLPKDKKPRGIVFLLHGYGAHIQFEYFHPTEVGEPHTKFEGTLVDGCVRAGWAVHGLDHQSHGRSEGVDDMRAYFHKFSHLADEANDYIEKVLLAPSADSASYTQSYQGMPIILWSVSMGGATAVTMARKNPQPYTGLVLYAPMISLEKIRKQEIALGITNGQLEGFASLLSTFLPTVALTQAAKNTVHPKAQEEFDKDPLTYHDAVRNRVAASFLEVSGEFLDGGLRNLKTPFITYHSCRDTFTDPYGSEKLVEMASLAPEDKTYIKVGQGLDIDADIWHALACEPGHEQISAHAIAWIDKRVAK